MENPWPKTTRCGDTSPLKEVENPDEYLPDYLEVKCPHCGSPDIEDEHGNPTLQK